MNDDRSDGRLNARETYCIFRHSVYAKAEKKMGDEWNQAAGAEEFKVIGYYISEVIDMPDYLKRLGKRMLSVSSCLGEMHPALACIVQGRRSMREQIASCHVQVSGGMIKIRMKERNRPVA